VCAFIHPGFPAEIQKGKEGQKGKESEKGEKRRCWGGGAI
jgi:hypothetical protein